MENLVLEIKDGYLLAACSGEVTFEVVPKIKEKLNARLAETEYQALVLDLSGVVFLDSTGISLLVSLNTRLRNEGKPLYLLRTSDQVRKTLDMVQLLNFFTTLNSLQDIDALSRP